MRLGMYSKHQQTIQQYLKKKIQHLIGKGEENYKRLLDSSREEFLPLMTSYGTGQTNRLTTGRHLGSRKIDPLYTSTAQGGGGSFKGN
jgi:hypothetical protein